MPINHNGSRRADLAQPVEETAKFCPNGGSTMSGACKEKSPQAMLAGSSGVGVEAFEVGQPTFFNCSSWRPAAALIVSKVCWATRVESSKSSFA